MARHHLINGIQVAFTAEEETARDIEEQVWRDGAYDRAISKLRTKRNRLLAETDFYALSDVTMSEEMTTYRQALRDLPDGLTTVDEVEAKEFPTKTGE
tara:strand:+ start:494 stop:787 length:294 start_codon:yes stop_codon:yes gene_type:complete